MQKWESPVDRLIREAMEAGKFDDLPGKGKPVNLDGGFDATLRRILRDNGATHPVLETRHALEAELQAARRHFRHDGQEASFRRRIHDLNRDIRLFNLRSPLPNFHLRTIDADKELLDLR